MQPLKHFRKQLRVMLLLSLVAALMGCTTPSHKAPCPNFGRYCHQVPVNR